MKILVVEDDALIGKATEKSLVSEGYRVDWVRTREDAKLSLKTQDYDLILLDIGLPDGSGLTLLSEARKQKIATPVLILTALNATADRVRGLDMGADDYLVKPYALDELLARIRAIHRRQHGITTPTVTLHGVTLDPAAHSIRHEGELVDLGPKEFAILQITFERAGKVVTKADLEEQIYGWGEEVASNAVEVIVHRIRKKLGPNIIKTVRGVGYLTERES